jgi:IS5 family transposase
MKLSALAALLIANALPSAAAAPTVEVFAGETEMKVAVPARVDDVKRAKDEIIILVEDSDIRRVAGVAEKEKQTEQKPSRARPGRRGGWLPADRRGD